MTPHALVVLEQRVRPDAKDTLEYFASQGVKVKVISGDNAVSVGAVAGSLGLPGGDTPVDARSLPEDRDALADTLDNATTFGRVRPDQKRAMVGALQSRGHTVAMTGDGVNDVLALKDADIGVAMGSGSPATRAVAQIVLLDNRFATLPYVVGEGRRVIGNIERVSNLFLTKTVYSVLLALLVGVTGVLSEISDVDPLPYPFLPRHVTIAAWFTIGIPAFILSLAPNNERARPGFVKRVMRLAVPSGVIIGVATFVSYLLAYAGPTETEEQRMQASTSALITLITIALWVLAVVARPYTWWKLVLIGGSVVAYVILFAWPFTRDFFALDPSNVAATTSAFVCGAVGIVLVELAWTVTGRLSGERRRDVRRRLLLTSGLRRSEEPQGVGRQQLGALVVGEELGVAHDLPGRAFAERVGVIAADDDLVLAHRVDEQAQCGGVEHHAVDEEAVGVLARRVRRVTADELATAMPGVVEAAEPEREAAAAVGETDPQRSAARGRTHRRGSSPAPTGASRPASPTASGPSSGRGAGRWACPTGARTPGRRRRRSAGGTARSPSSSRSRSPTWLPISTPA